MDPSLPKNHPKNLAAAATSAVQSQQPAEPAVTRQEIAQFLAQLVLPRVHQCRAKLGRPGLFVLENRFSDFYADLKSALGEAVSNDFIVEALFRNGTEPPYQTNAFAIETLNRGSNIVWLLPSAKDIRPFAPVVDGVVRIPPLNAQLLSQACKVFYGLEAAPPVEDASWISQVSPNDFLINSAVSGDPIPHIRKSVEARLRDFDCAGALPLDSLDGLAEAREWAKDLIEDIRAVSAGTLTWNDIERGAVLAGPRGAGKSTLAKAIARELGWRVLTASAYPWAAAAEKQPAEAEKALEFAFRAARAHAPCVLLIENIEFLPPLAAAFRSEIVDYDAEFPFIVIGTTTAHPEQINDAMLRSCQLERVIPIPMPSAAVLSELFRQSMEKFKHEITGEQFRQLGNLSFGRAGDDVDFLVRRAQRTARRDDNRPIRFDDIVDAFFDIPSEKARTKVGEERLRATAYHEAGHTVMRYLSSDGGQYLHYVTIVPTPGAGGFMAAHPPDVRYTERELLAEIRVSLGGRAAEEILLGSDGVSTGSGGSERSDLARATAQATIMITRYGFNEGRRLALRDSSIDQDPELRKEVEALLAREYQSTIATLREHWRLVESLAERLIVKQELTGEEVRALLSALQENLQKQAA